MPSPSVLAVVNSFPSASETFVLRKLRGLRDAGLEVSVASSSFGPDARDSGFALRPTTPWRQLRRASGVGWATPASGVASAAGHAVAPRPADHLTWRQRVLLAPLASPPTDIVHFEFSGIAVSYRALLPALRPARLVVSCRGSAEQLRPRADPARAAALEQTFAAVDLVHCVSEAMAETVSGLGAPEDKIVVIRPAVPVQDFARIGDLEGDGDGVLRVLSIGRLHWAKGLDDGIRAVERLVRSGIAVDYRIVGDGPEREKLAFLADHLGLADHVSFLGVRDQRGVREQLGEAHAVLLPSLSEGISNVALEAMAAGRPVVSTRCGGMAEVIDHGVEGRLVPIGDVDAMADALAALAADREGLVRMGAAARARAVASFGLGAHIDAFVEAYRGMLEG